MFSNLYRNCRQSASLPSTSLPPVWRICSVYPLLAAAMTLWPLSWKYDIISKILPCQLMLFTFEQSCRISSRSELKWQSSRLFLKNVTRTRTTARRTRWVVLWDQLMIQKLLHVSDVFLQKALADSVVFSLLCHFSLVRLCIRLSISKYFIYAVYLLQFLYLYW